MLRTVGLQGRGGNYAANRVRLLRIGVDDARFQRTERPVVATEDLRAAVAASTSVAEVASRLGLGTGSTGHRRVLALLARDRLDTTHFLGRASNRGRRDLPARGRPLSELLRADSPTSTSALKRRLRRAGLLEERCAGCGGTSRQGQPMPLELDQVNGDRTDDRLENLRLLCPNCHAQTPTYRGRDIGRRSVGGEPP